MVERRNKQVVEFGFSMLTRTGLALMFQEYTFKCAIHLINRLLTSTLSHKIPYELFYQKNFTYGYLRTFGSFLKPFASHKLKPKSIPCIFWGYPPNHKGYWCIDITSRKVYLNPHVVFHETHFSFLTLTCMSKNPFVY